MPSAAELQQLKNDHADYLVEHYKKNELLKGLPPQVPQQIALQTLWAFHQGRHVVFHGPDATKAYEVLKEADILEDEALTDENGEPCLKLHRDRWTDYCHALQDAQLTVTQKS